MADNLVDRVAKILTRYSMIPASGRVGVAVSGGADSVVLLHVLRRLQSRFPCELTILHVNHQLRGVESDGDEAFVRDLASSQGLDLVAERTTLPAGNLEQGARDARRAFFSRLRSELSLDRIALGHTRSDQAETVLYRFLRGSGTAGLAGMRPLTADGLIRPLLDMSREEVRDWARAEGLAWREDSSNADERFARNVLRNEAIPALQAKFNPALETVLARTAEVAQAEEDYWSDLVSTTYGQIAERIALGSFFQVDKLEALPPALRRRVIRQAISETKGGLRSIDIRHVDAVLSLCNRSDAHDRVVIPGVDALRSYGTLLLTEPGKLNEGKRHYKVEVSLGETGYLPFLLGQIRLEPMGFGVGNCATVKTETSPSTEIAYINSDALRGPLHVRNWEPGDVLRRKGHRSLQKLKTLFQEERILLWERRHWPILVCGEEVVWARRFGCSADFEADPGNERAIRLVYRFNSLGLNRKSVD